MTELDWQIMNIGVSAVLFCFAVTTVTVSAAPDCRMSEYRCENGRCVPLNRYCNNVNDCGDSSDEPRHCTPCNRTYRGEVTKTYYLELHRPKEDKIPFICHLTFEAGGGEFGDLVQLTFDSFTLGRFVSFTTDGCPDGALTISESTRPQVGGSWCGTSWGPAIYYSETKSVTISVNLYRLSKDQSGYNFDFRMEYKLLRKKQATVRYGGGRPYVNTTSPTIIEEDAEFYLGDLITGTYCSRIFSDCDRKRCRLQSPNFPGVYPRNLTCYYAVRQHEIPPGKHALITVRQPKGQLISIRSQSALYGTASTRELKVWNACDDVQDYVTIYDGYTTRDPVILKFCGGGEAVPETISSGHELLVEFSTSPYGTFLHPAPAQSLHGFQLEVNVRFVDQQSPAFVKNKRSCEFWLRGTNKGVLESPLHSLPANTTCLYHLQGMDTSVSPSPIPFRPLSPRYPDGYWRHTGLIFPPPRYRVWLSVVKFHVPGAWKPQKLEQEVCRSYLNVWDGQLWTGTNCNDLFCSSKDKLKAVPRGGVSTSAGGSRNVTLLARYCKEHIPRSCDHSMLANVTRFPRPCSLSESFLTSGDSLTLEFRVADSTALRPVTFRALYEFVDLHLDGQPYGSGPCSRMFAGPSQDSQQKFRSPRDIFLYGRGGAKNISCVYRFEAQKDEKVKITLTNLVIKGRRCKTDSSTDTDRLQCNRNATAAVRFFEVPWGDVPPVPRDCLCSGDEKILPFTYVSTSNVVEIHFDVTGMNASDDFSTLFFEGTWKFIRTPVCSRDLRMRGPSGSVRFNFPSESPGDLNCESYPRVIIPSGRRYLYVKISGVIMRHSRRSGNGTSVSSVRCGTANRIIVHTALFSAVICPYASSSRRHNLVEVFSEGWSLSEDESRLPVDKIGIDHLGKELSRTVVVEFVGKEAGTYSVMWLELSRRRALPPNGLGLFLMKAIDECTYRCPELDACINATVWCDGVEDCPSGIDEALTHCSILLQLPPLYLFLGAMLLLCGIFGIIVAAWRIWCRRPRSILQTRLKSLSSDTAIIDEKGLIC